MYKKSKYNYVMEKGEVYIYNLLTRSFLCIDKDIWEYVESNNYEMIDSDSIQILLEEGIILYNTVDEQLVLKDKVETPLFTNENSAIFLSMTSGCNFSCPYCYQDFRTQKEENIFISKEKIDVISLFIEESKFTNLAIVYFGGEPTLNSEILMYAMNKFRVFEDKMHITHSIITNGYILTEELLSLYRELDGLMIQITIDGNKNSHNSTRVHKEYGETFETVYSNLCRLASEVPNHVVVRVNVANTDFDEYYQLIDKMNKDGLAGKISVVFETVFDGQVSKHVSCSDKSVVTQLFDYATKKGFESQFSIEYGPCLAHAKHGFAIDENLYLYNCPGQIYGKKLGFISNEGKLHITDNEWYKTRYVRKDCMENCMYAPVCFGGCKINDKCRKDIFKTLLPKVVQNMIEEYKEGVHD